MKQLAYFIIYFVVYLATIQADDVPVDNAKLNSNVKTTFGTFNATFSWEIQNLQLFDFGSRYSVKPLVSPNLTVTDDESGTAYDCKIIILPEYRYNRIHYNDMDEFDNFELVKYQITADFSDTPIKKEYQYSVNGQVYESSMIEKSQLKEDNTVTIVAKAYFHTRTESTKV